MTIEIVDVEDITATRIHLDPEAGGAWPSSWGPARPPWLPGRPSCGPQTRQRRWGFACCRDWSRSTASSGRGSCSSALIRRCGFDSPTGMGACWRCSGCWAREAGTSPNWPASCARLGL